MRRRPKKVENGRNGLPHALPAVIFARAPPPPFRVCGVTPTHRYRYAAAEVPKIECVVFGPISRAGSNGSEEKPRVVMRAFRCKRLKPLTGTGRQTNTTVFRLKAVC